MTCTFRELLLPRCLKLDIHLDAIKSHTQLIDMPRTQLTWLTAGMLSSFVHAQ